MDTSDSEAVITSDLTDLNRVQLADLEVMTDEATAGMLRRIVAATSGQRVPVAAFNSSV